MRTAGVLGGMGPEATVDFIARVIAATPGDKDQDHIPMLIDHNPGVPCRLAGIYAKGEDPGPTMAAMAKRLESAGADFLVMPCNTAHAFADRIVAAVTIPFVSIVDETVAACRDRSVVGLIATDACLRAGLYQRKFDDAGVRYLLPDAAASAAFMRLVHRIKAGDRQRDISQGMSELANALIADGAEAVVAGCTEVPLVLGKDDLAVPLISSTEVLAAATVAMAVA